MKNYIYAPIIGLICSFCVASCSQNEDQKANPIFLKHVNSIISITENTNKTCGANTSLTEKYLSLKCQNINDILNMDKKSNLTTYDANTCLIGKYPLLSGGRSSIDDAQVSEYTKLNDIFNIPKNIEEIEQTECAANSGDQIAWLKLMIWSWFEIRNENTLCEIEFNEIVANRQNYICHKVSNEFISRWKKLRKFPDIWYDYVNIIPENKHILTKNLENMPQYCTPLMSIYTSYSLCGISEPLMLRRAYILKQNKNNNPNIYDAELEFLNKAINASIGFDVDSIGLEAK